MSSVDNRVVRMQFDNAQFERGIRESRDSITALKKELDFQEQIDNLRDMQLAANNTKFDVLLSGVQSIVDKFTFAGTITRRFFETLADDALRYGKRFINAVSVAPLTDGFHEYQTQMDSIQTILANTQSKGSTIEDVTKALDELNEYADKTIYNFTEMTRNIGTFTAAGLSLETSVAAIKGVANLAAVSGANSQKASVAMYQLSQALSTGVVKLQDWNSVVNAGMGGELFQNALKRTAKHMGTNVDYLIKKYGSFRESLSRGNWLTAEILSETLKQISGAYTESELRAQKWSESEIKDIMQLATTATEAATKVKTFPQLLDTIKEALGSGWSESFRIIFGDFEEAREMFTKMSDHFGELISKSAESRNKILEDWKVLGGRQDLINAFWNIVKAAEGIVEPVRAAFHKIFIGSDELKENLADVANQLGPAAYVSNIRILKHWRRRLIDELTKDQLGPAAYTTNQQVLDHWYANQNVMALVLKKISESIEQFTEAMKPSEKTMERLQRIFEGIFSLAKVVSKFFGSIFDGVFSPLTEDAGNFLDVILEVLATIGDIATAWSSWIIDTGIFDRLTRDIRNFYEAIRTFLAPIWRAFSGFFGDLGHEISIRLGLDGLDLSNWYRDAEKTRKVFDMIDGILKEMGAKLKAGFNFIADIFKRTWSVMRPYVTSVVDQLLSLFGLKDFNFGGANTTAGKVMYVFDRIIEGVTRFMRFLSPYLRKVGVTVGGVLLRIIGVNTNDFKLAESYEQRLDLIFQGIGRRFEQIKNMMSRIGAALKPITDVIWRNSKSAASALWDAFSGIFKPYDDASEHLGDTPIESGFIRLGQIFKTFGSWIATAWGFAKKGLAGFGEWIEYVFREGGAGRYLLDRVLIGGLGAKALNILRALVGVLEGLSLANAFNQTTIALQNMSMSVQNYFGKKSLVKMLMSVAAYVGITVAGIVILANLFKENKQGFVYGIGVMAALFTYIAYLIKKMSDLNKFNITWQQKASAASGIYAMGSLFRGMAWLMVGIGICARLLDKVQNPMAVALGIATILLAMGVMIYALQSSMTVYNRADLINKKFFRKATVTFSQMIGLSVVVWAASKAMSRLATIPEDRMWMAISGILAIFAGISLVFFASRSVPNGRTGLRGVFRLGLTIAVLMGVIYLISGLDEDRIRKMFGVTAMIGMIFVSLAVLAGFSRGVTTGSMWGLVGALVATIFMLDMVYELANKFGRLSNAKFEQAMWGIGAAIGSVMLTFIGIGVLMNFLRRRVFNNYAHSYDMNATVITFFASVAGLLTIVGGLALAFAEAGRIYSTVGVWDSLAPITSVMLAMLAVGMLFKSFASNKMIGNNYFDIPSVIAIFASVAGLLFVMGLTAVEFGTAAAIFAQAGGNVGAYLAPILSVIGAMAAISAAIFVIRQIAFKNEKGGYAQIRTVITYFAGLGALMLVMGATAVIFGAAARIFNSVSVDASVAPITSAVLAVLAIAAAMSLMATFTGTGKGKDAITERAKLITLFEGLGTLLLVLAASTIGLAEAAVIFEDVRWGSFAKMILAMLSSIALVVGAIWAVSTMVTKYSQANVEAAMGGLVVSLLGFAATAVVLGYVIRTMPTGSKSWQQFGMMVAAMTSALILIIGSIAVVSSIASANATGLFSGMIALGIGMIEFITLAYFLSDIITRMPTGATAWQQFGMMVKAMAASMLIIIGSITLLSLVASSFGTAMILGVVALAVGIAGFYVLANTMVETLSRLNKIDTGAIGKLALSMVAVLGILSVFAGLSVVLFPIAIGLVILSTSILKFGLGVQYAGIGIKNGAEGFKIFLDVLDRLAVYDVEKIESIKNNLVSLAESIKQIAPQVAEAISTIFGFTAVAVMKVIGALVPTLVETFAGMFAAIADAISEYAVDITVAGTSIIAALVDGFMLAVPTLSIALDAIFSALGTYIEAKITQLGDKMNNWMVNAINKVPILEWLIPDEDVDVANWYQDEYMTSFEDYLNEAGMQDQIANTRAAIARTTEEMYQNASFDQNGKMTDYGYRRQYGSNWEAVKELERNNASQETIARYLADHPDQGIFGTLFGNVGDIGTTISSAVSGLGDMLGLGEAGAGVFSGFTDQMEGLLNTMQSPDMTDPEITPVVDMDNVEASSDYISNNLTGTKDLTIRTSYEDAHDASRSILDRDAAVNAREGTGNVNNYIFNQTNNSPKALSRLDIYRESRSGLGRLARMG